ncbi:hypothetical protein G6F59_018472 [Rhizopus arrhizus]|nr:hypothetical protein G6F59_018472 [Rhizopus arrhizus]
MYSEDMSPGSCPLPMLTSVEPPPRARPCAGARYMYAKRDTPWGDPAAGAVRVSTVGFLLLAPLMLWFTRAGA